MHISLHSPLTFEECVRRITESVDPMTYWSRMGLAYFKPMLGEVRGSCLTLRRRQYFDDTSIPARNSWAPVFRGTMVEHQGGTRIEGTCALSPVVSAFMPICLRAVALLGLPMSAVGLYRLLSGSETGCDACMMTLGPLMMLLFGLLLDWHGRRTAEDDTAYIVAFLRDTLEAEDADGAAET